MVNVRQSRKDFYTILTMFLLVWIVFQDFLLAILYKTTGNYPVTKVLFHLKDILLLFLGGWGLWKSRGFNNRRVLFGCVLIYLAIALFWLAVGLFQANADFVDLVASMRSAILAPLLIVIGMSCDKRSMTRFFRGYSTYFMTLIALIGLLDYFLDRTIGTVKFWTDTIGFGTYLEEIKNNALINGLPGNFYGQYGGDFFSQKRLVSVWGTPLTSGYGLLIPVLFCFVSVLLETKTKRRLGFLLMLAIQTLALVLTFTRAIILSAAVAAVILVWLYKPRWRPFLLILFFAGIAFLISKIDVVLSYVYDGSTVEHINQVTDSLAQIDAFGSGYATFGIYSGTGTESTYITIAGQIGIISVVLYVFMYIACLLRARMSIIHSSFVSNRVLAIVAVSSGIIFFITGFVSEQLTAFTSIAPFFVLLGVEQNQVRYRIRYKMPQMVLVRECCI